MAGRRSPPRPDPRCIVVASDIENDVPIIDLRVKKAVSKRGAKLIVAYPDGVDLDRHQGTVHVTYEKGHAAEATTKLAGHDLLKNPGGPVAILFGDGRGSEDMNALATACGDLAAKVGGKLLPLYRATNERGAIAAGVARWDSLNGIDTLLSWGPPPTGGIPKSVKFIAAWDHLPRPGYEKAVVLPAATFAERQGSYTNVEGTVQFLRPPIALGPPLKDGWEVLAELGSALGLHLDYPGISPIQREMSIEPPDPGPAPAAVLVGPAHP